MDIVLDAELEEKIKKDKLDFHETTLLLNVVKTLKKSFSGQLLKVIEENGFVFKIMEKRATRSYRVYFVYIIYNNKVVIMGIINKNKQNEYLDYLYKNIFEIYKRNEFKF